MDVPGPIRVPLLDLDLLSTLVAIAETGNFSRAAEKVGRTPSAVSMQVKKIEDMIERTVFVRDSRSVRLTHDGMLLVAHARRMLTLNREAMSRYVAPELVGEVRLGAPDDVVERFLTEMVRRFTSTFPGVTLTVVVDGTSELLAQVRERRLDLAVVTAEAGFEGDEVVEIVHREPLVWAMREGGSAIERTPLPIAVWEEDCLWRQAAISGFEATGRPFQVALESASIAGQRAAVLIDLAVACLPASALGGPIVEVDPTYGLPSLPTYALGLVVAENPTPPAEEAALYVRTCRRCD